MKTTRMRVHLLTDWSADLRSSLSRVKLSSNCKLGQEMHIRSEMRKYVLDWLYQY